MGVAETMYETPGEAIDRLCREDGRHKGWIAGRLGITPSSLSRRIKGEVPLSYLEAKELAAIFDVPLATFWKEGAA